MNDRKHSHTTLTLQVKYIFADKSLAENLLPTSVNHGAREKVPSRLDDLRLSMGYRSREDSQPMALLMSMWQNRLGNKENIDPMKEDQSKSNNKSRREELSLEDASRFWANRGRREEEENEPFWANRGRNVDETGPFWANRGRSVDEEGPFYANRGRAANEEGPFYANRGRHVDEEGPFYANRGRAANEEGPFYANRGRSVDEEGPFYANRGREVNEVGPFWANRGRDVDNVRFAKKRGVKNEEHFPLSPSKEFRSITRGARDSLTGNDLLYAEEPSWISLDRRQVTGSPSSGGIGHESEPFWISRGRRLAPDPRFAVQVLLHTNIIVLIAISWLTFEIRT